MAVGATLAGKLAQRPPVAWVTGAFATDWITLPVGIAKAVFFAVGGPEFIRATCKRTEIVRRSYRVLFCPRLYQIAVSKPEARMEEISWEEGRCWVSEERWGSVKFN